MSESLRKKDVMDYLINELKSVDNKETKQAIQRTINHFKAKDANFQEEWSKFVEFAKQKAESFNEKIKKDGLVLLMEEKEWAKFNQVVLELKIKTNDETERYECGFCDIINYSNEEVDFDGRVIGEESTTDFSELKEWLTLEIENGELMELCQQIKKR